MTLREQSEPSNLSKFPSFEAWVDALIAYIEEGPGGEMWSDAVYALRRQREQIAACLASPDEAPSGWQPIETAPKDGTLIIGALIRDGKVWRIHDMKHNGLAFYTIAGGSLPQMTHWFPTPPRSLTTGAGDRG